MNKQIFASLVLAVLLISMASAVTIKSVTSTPSEISPGENFKLKIELENNLDDDATNVDVSLNLQDKPISPTKTTEVYIGDLDSDDSDSATFDLVADAGATAQTYKIPVTLSYTVGNKTATKSTSVSVTVSGRPNLILSSDSVVLQNQKNKVQIQVTNNGLAKAKFLQVELGGGNYDILSSNLVYVGDLDSDDYNTVSFDLFVKDSSQLSLPVTLTYRDVENNPYTISNSISLRAYSQEEAVALGLVAKNNTFTYLIVVVVLLVAWLVYRAIRKRRKRKMAGR